MKTPIIFLSALILFGFVSCREKLPDDKSFITIPIKEVKNSSESFSNFITGIKTIQLETNRNCLIGNIEEFRSYNDDIYILESPGSIASPGSLRRILRFNSEGDFICEIGDYGRGPEELISPRDFIFEEDTIEIWSRYKISRHTIDGDFIENVFNAHVPGPGFIKDNGDYILFHSISPPYMFTKRNKSGQQIDSMVYLDVVVHGNAEHDKVLRYNKTTRFFAGMHDTVYSINNAGVYPSAAFKYEGVSSPYTVLKDSNDPRDFIKLSPPSVANYLENSNIIFIRYTLDREWYYCLVDKKRLEFYYYKAEDFENAYSIPLKDPLHLTENNELVIAYFHHDLDNPEVRKDQRLPAIKPDDNPLLIKFRLDI